MSDLLIAEGKTLHSWSCVVSLMSDSDVDEGKTPLRWSFDLMRKSYTTERNLSGGRL